MKLATGETHAAYMFEKSFSRGIETLMTNKKFSSYTDQYWWKLIYTKLDETFIYPMRGYAIH